jgi:hypothetical protein
VPIYVRTDLYEPVCSQLLENSGLSTLGIMKDADFIKFTNEAVSDFLTYTEIKKKVVAIQTSAFVNQYEQPDYLIRTSDALYNGSGMYHSYSISVDNYNQDHENDPFANPSTWYIENSSAKNIQVTPSPQYNGDEIIIANGDGFYGTFSQTSDVLDFDIECDPLFPDGLLGTIGDCHAGDVYVEFAAPMFGTVSEIITSNGANGNLTLIGHVNAYNYVQGLDEHVELINPTFDVYLRYGIMSRIFAGDSEYKDETRERYCVARFLEGINLCRAIMNLEPLDALPTRRR